MYNADFLRNYVKQSQGVNIYVKPSTGSDSNTGLTPTAAVKTLAKALSLATANRNDTVYMFAESNSAASTTDYQSSTDVGLVWNKDLVHLIGVCNTSIIGQRARIAWLSTVNNTTSTPLFTLSANGCNIENIAFFAGIGDAEAIGALKITGDRNHVKNCQISGIGHDTMDVAGAYSLSIDSGHENTIENCYIGLDTIARGTAANSEILLDTASSRNYFKGCIISSMVEHTTNSPQVRIADTTGIDRWLIFDNCIFYNFATNYLIKQDQIFKTGAITQGYVLVKDCMATTGDGTAGVWDTSNKVLVAGSAILAADTGGFGYPV